MPDLSRALDAMPPLSAEGVALLVLLAILPCFVIYTREAQRGWRPALRRIGVYERLKRLANEASEAGRPVHAATGGANLAGAQSAESLAGLVAFDYLARKASVLGQAVAGSAADGASLLVAQGLLREALAQAGYPEQYRASSLHYLGPDALAYASGAAELAEQQDAVGTMMLGRFGAEGLLLAEAAALENRPLIGGTAEPEGSALLHISLDESVQGEEVFAAGAYLHRPSHLGSLATEDLLRAAAVAAIVVGVVLASLGLLG